MGAVDIKTKQYVSRPEVFADLFNHLMYDGEAILKPEDCPLWIQQKLRCPMVLKQKPFLRRSIVMC